MAKTRKISEKEFWAILRKNAGLYARTARAIEKEFNVSYTRQSVRERAEKNPAMLTDIREETVDIAEEGLIDLMWSNMPSVKLRAIEVYLKSKGADRGYAINHNVRHDGKVEVLVEFVDEQNKSQTS